MEEMGGRTASSGYEYDHQKNPPFAQPAVSGFAFLPTDLTVPKIVWL